MPGVSRVGVDYVKLLPGQATIIGNLAPSVIINGSPCVVKNAQVQPHGSGIHGSSSKMSGCSSTVFANGIVVCRDGDAANCGHVAVGSGDVIAG